MKLLLKFQWLFFALFLGFLAARATATTYYVDINSPGPTPPYTSWATASRDIQSAIDTATSGDSILVNDGVYQTGGRVIYGSLTNRVAINKAVTVQSVHGPSATIIRGYQMPGVIFGDSAVRCVYMTNNATLIGFTLTNGGTRTNTANFIQEQSAAGVWCESTNAVISNCVVIGNMAFGNSGGSYFGTFYSCYFTSNSGTVYGGGAWSSILNGCALIGNSTAYIGGGAYQCTMNNCTIIGTSGGAGAVACNLNNCIIYYNTGGNVSECTLSNCCTTPGAGGNNITDEPQMADFSHISAASPCLAAGNPAWVAGLDIDGETWSNPPAIGCDQYHAGSILGLLSQSFQASYTSVAPGFTVNFNALINGHASRNTWNFGDGTTASNRLYISHSWSAPGSYPVTFTVYNDSNPSGVSSVTTISVSPETHFVNQQNSTPAAPYNSWATAATNIQDAINSSILPGTTIFVTNGIYQSAGYVAPDGTLSAVVVTNPLILQSMTGAGTTLINGRGAMRCLYLANAATLEGFTLTNGFAGNGGGAYCQSLTATILNSSLLNNTGTNGGGVYYGALSNCQVMGNSAPGTGGGACASVLTDCVIARNYGSTGGGVYESTLTNCWVTNNTASNGGGGYQGALFNCLITGNSASATGGGVFGSQLNGCTVAGNSCAGGVGGTWSASSVNTIIYSNTASGGANWNFGSFSYCCTDPEPIGPGNITSAPLFVNAPGGDFHLQSNSPCINAGDNGSVVTTTDLDGNPRVIGSAVDIGAFEHQAPTIAITTEPQSATNIGGQPLTFSVAAISPYPMAYQWQFDGTNIPGATSTNLFLSDVESNNAGIYDVVISNGFVTATSSNAVLSVFYPPPVIVQGPTNLIVLLGSNAVFSVNATSYYSATLQWQFNGTNLTDGGQISGSTNSILTISNVQAGNRGTYEIIVADSYESVTSSALLQVISPIQITSQPTNENVLIGNTANLSVTANGTALNYQWYFNGSPMSNGGRISGSATPNLSIANLQSSDGGNYWVVITNTITNATSAVATLSPLTSPGPAVRYVNLNNPAPASPYLSWSTAATNIQDAINASVYGDDVIVTDGVYTSGGYKAPDGGNSCVAVTSVINLQSVDGPATTWISGSNLMRCVYLANGATLSGFTLTNGFASVNGGGVSCASTNSYISNCVILNNLANDYGGGVYGGNLNNCTLSGNVSKVEYGGGAFGSVLTNCLLTGNSATNGNIGHGGGGANCTFNNCYLNNNFSSFGAGAAFSILNNCTVSNNLANAVSLNTAEGGGVYGGVAQNTLIISNTVQYLGGGAFNTALSNCVVQGNHSQQQGGGAVIFNSETPGLSLNHCTLIGNWAPAAGGFGSSGIQPILTNCIISGNRAGTDAGVLFARLFNCSIINNVATNSDGGILNCIANNSIVYYNSAPTFPNVGGTISATNCCFGQDVTGGSGFFTNAPLFVNLAGGDFHLQSNSPCINSGNNVYAGWSTDLDGNPRIVGGTVDIGAYEYQSPVSMVSYQWLEQYGLSISANADTSSPNGTGFTVYQDWIAGLNPTNSASVLVMMPLAHTNNTFGIKVTWQSVNGILYNLQRSTNLTAQPPFSTIKTNILGIGGTTSYTDTSATNGTPYFYRVRVP